MKQTLIILFFALGLFTSCKKNFDEPNPSNPTVASFWQSSEDAVKGINAVYSTFHRGYAGYSRVMYFHGMLKGDEGFGSGGDGGLNTLMSFSMNNNNFGLTRDTWTNMYQGIYRANQVIANVPAIQMDATLQKRIIAEAKFLRGLFYFNLTLYFGRPPLVLEQSTVGLQPLQPRNATPEEAWTQVAKDFTEAAADLPNTYGAADLGRATTGAAYAMLGKTYLQQKKYQQAADAFAWLITGLGAGIYNLTTAYRDNFIITRENNIESVFEIQFALRDDENSDNDVDEAARPNPGASIAKFYAPGGPGFQDGAARRWVVNEFHLEKTSTGQRDPRLAATFFYDSTDVGGPTATIVYGQTWASRYGLNSARVFYRKLLNDHWRNTETFNSPNNYRMVRYADVLLMYAEALNGLGQTATAYQYVDRVRVRAGMRTLTVAMPGLNQAAFLNQLKRERILELSGEGWRFADLARWSDLSPALAGRDPEFTNFRVGKHEWYPIPQSDIDLNPNLTQNPGY